MKRGGELKRITPLPAGTSTLRRTELLRKNAIKPGTKRMRQSRSTDKPTSEESVRMGMVKKLGCICCMLNEQFGLARASRASRPGNIVPCDAHHLLSGGIRRGHDFTIGGCAWHHRGEPPAPMHERDAIAKYGPSIATGSKPFHLMYGTDDELLEFQNALLAQVRAA